MMLKRRKEDSMPRGSPGAARCAPARPGRLLALAALAALAAMAAMVAGCGHSGQPTSSGSPTPAAVTKCGSARTAANVPVRVEVIQGHVTCGTALHVEHAYAKAIQSGKEPGNGGGGPVKVNGWTCQGFATPVVLSTGKASKCVRSGNEILEILPPAS
jgi:hypothetical protein